MTILIACEESQVVCKPFRVKGHEAYSCDLQECSGGHPEWHLKDDLLNVIGQGWDKVISFPPCTDLAVSGARWFPDKRANGLQEKSITFFLNVWRRSNAVENPIGIMNNGRYVKQWFPKLYEYATFIGFPWKPSQIIQPWQFGHGETKATCLWLKGLPLLTPTNLVEGREQRIWKMAPGADRAKLRSKTFPGIANAMAEQWG
jgi:hypothetical protein